MPKTASAILILFGLIFGSVGGFITYNTYNIILNGEITQGKIIEYNSHINDGATMYTPVVEFNCSGNIYTTASSISSSSKSYNLGEITDIYCIKNNFRFKNGFDKYFGIIFLIIGLGVLSIPFIIKFFDIKRERLKQELLRNGDYIKSTINFVGYNRTYRVNGRSPMYFTCEYLDKDENRTYTFKSGNFWTTTLEEYIKTGNERKVYINKMNMKKYYIDIDDIEIKK